MTAQKVRDIVGWVMLLVFLVVAFAATAYTMLFHHQVGVRVVCGVMAAGFAAATAYYATMAHHRLKG
jgi:hypothetical protein